MPNIGLSLLGVQELRERFANLPDRIRDTALERMAQIAFDKAFEGADTHTKTGALIGSLELVEVAEGFEVSHDLQEAPHAVFVHWGTEAHEIRPRSKKALRWPAGTGGATEFAFAKVVNHPGFGGHPWLVEARDEVLSRMSEVIDEVEAEI